MCPRGGETLSLWICMRASPWDVVVRGIGHVTESTNVIVYDSYMGEIVVIE